GGRRRPLARGEGAADRRGRVPRALLRRRSGAARGALLHLSRGCPRSGRGPRPPFLRSRRIEDRRPPSNSLVPPLVPLGILAADDLPPREGRGTGAGPSSRRGV